MGTTSKAEILEAGPLLQRLRKSESVFRPDPEPASRRTPRVRTSSAETERRGSVWQGSLRSGRDDAKSMWMQNRAAVAVVAGY